MVCNSYQYYWGNPVSIVTVLRLHIRAVCHASGDRSVLCTILSISVYEKSEIYSQHNL